MQNHNRFFALLLVFVLLLSLTGCVGAFTAPIPTPTLAPTATPEPLIQKEGSPITFGQMSGNTYTNAFFDVAVDLDDLWFAESTQNLDELNGFTGEVPKAEREQAYLDLLNNGNMVREYYAHSNTGLKAISIDIYDYSKQSDQYPDIFMHYINRTYGLTKQLKKHDFNILDGLSSSANIAGELQFCFFFSYEKNGIVWNCAFAMMCRHNYVMTILFSNMVTDHVDDMIALFHKPAQ